MAKVDVSKRRAEFETHVWDHAGDEFQTTFDLRAPLDEASVARVIKLVRAIADGQDDEAVGELLRRQCLGTSDHILTIIQLVGLTRNKPKSDLTVPLTAKGIATPATVARFAENPRVWKYAGPYFVARMKAVFTPIMSLSDAELAGALQALNQATWPGYIRQERAKRSGGYAEQRLAIVLRGLNLPFEPQGKADNGLTSDVTIAGESFDLAIPNARAPKLCIISMLHSSNIGQYGESKAGDAERAKTALAGLPSKPKLGVLADGVGFHSNTAGLMGLLSHADEFFQLATLWKAAVMAAEIAGKKLVMVLPDAASHEAFIRDHANTVRVISKIDDKPGWVDAGEASLRLA